VLLRAFFVQFQGKILILPCHNSIGLITVRPYMKLWQKEKIVLMGVNYVLFY
jgi:hypothetical protein